jgi:hypothetical protein
VDYLKGLSIVLTINFNVDVGQGDLVGSRKSRPNMAQSIFCQNRYKGKKIGLIFGPLL